MAVCDQPAVSATRGELDDGDDFTYLDGLCNPRLFDELMESGLNDARKHIRAGKPPTKDHKFYLMIRSKDQMGSSSFCQILARSCSAGGKGAVS